MKPTFNHFDAQGNAVMVDVSEKAETERVAVASGRIRVNRAVMQAITSGTAKKGDVLGVARVAGIMGVKQTSSLIPMCHPLMLTKCSIDFHLELEACVIQAVCTAKIYGKTGVEMEALTGVQVALLTIYDMCKAMDRGMEIFDVHLEHKEGGKSGVYDRSSDRKECPLVAVSGVKNSGKTTFLERVIPLLTKKGMRVAVVKHDGHSFEPDVCGTDSFRLRKSGADAVAVYCDTHYMIEENKKVSYDILKEKFVGYDLILVEGEKDSSLPKLEIVRSAVSKDMVCQKETVLAVVTDCEEDFGVPRLDLNDYDAAATLLETLVRGKN